MAIPSIVEHTAKRFVSLLTFMATGALISVAILYAVDLSEKYLGSGIYAILAAVLILAMVASYYVARNDVEDEKRMQARILRELSKD